MESWGLKSSGTMAAGLLVLSMLLLPAFGLKSEANERMGLHSDGSVVYSKVFFSEPFQLTPGAVHKKYYHLNDMPEGHVAIRTLIGEIVDEFEVDVPLNEVYLHHWFAAQLYMKKQETVGVDEVEGTSEAKIALKMGNLVEAAKKSGLFWDVFAEEAPPTCRVNSSPGARFGAGAETRGTKHDYPAPYGVEINNPDKVPDGQEDVWLAQIHAIDSRGAVDAQKCLECNCEAFNATRDERGRPLPDGYYGGLLCCYEGVSCRVKDGFEAGPRILRARFTVKWVEMSPRVVPIRIFGLDVTPCKIEYNIQSCSDGGNLGKCVDTLRREMVFPMGGKLVYAVGHQHVGGMGITFSGQDGRTLCRSTPMYGNGAVAGNEAGYVVGMKACVNNGLRIQANETVVVTSTYSRLGGGHTGVMGLFFLAVAVDGDYTPPPGGLDGGVQGSERSSNAWTAASTAEKEHDQELWRVSLWGATGGFFVGIFVVGAIAALTLLLAWQHQDLGVYAPLALP